MGMEEDNREKVYGIKLTRYHNHESDGDCVLRLKGPFGERLKGRKFENQIV